MCTVILIIQNSIITITVNWQVERLSVAWPVEPKETTTTTTMRIKGRQSTAKHTLTALNRCSSKGTAVRLKVVEELDQGRNRPAEGRGHSRHKLTALPCRTPAQKTCATDALRLQIRLR